MQVSTTEFRRGLHIVFRDEVFQIVDVEFVNPGKGSAFYRTKLRNMNTGRTIDFTFKSGETVEQYDVYTKDMQFLYRDGDDLHFMDTENYNQIVVPASVAGTAASFLNDGETYTLLLHDDQGIGLKAPKRVVATVAEAMPAARGNTATGLTKSVTLENGLEIDVPAFVETGDRIALNPETLEYLERAS
jgi:elongation factor P